MGAEGAGVGRARCGAVQGRVSCTRSSIEAFKAPLCVRHDDGARDPLAPVAFEVGRRPVTVDALGVVDVVRLASMWTCGNSGRGSAGGRPARAEATIEVVEEEVGRNCA